jgi:hypothetical protein
MAVPSEDSDISPGLSGHRVQDAPDQLGARTGAVTNLAEGGLGYVDGALFQGLLGEAEAAYNGNCH